MLKSVKPTLNSKLFLKDGDRSDTGFTLLEVMVSVSIIAIVLVSILKLQGQTMTINETIRFYTLAPLLADAKIAEIRLNPETFDLSSSGDFGEDYPGYSWEARIEEVKIEVMESPEIHLNKIDMAIQFNKGELNFSVRHFLNAESGEKNE